MTDLQLEIAQGEISQRAYDELKSKFDLIRANLHEKWERSEVRASEDREVLFHTLHVLGELERAFKRDIDTGKMASTQLETENATR